MKQKIHSLIDLVKQVCGRSDSEKAQCLTHSPQRGALTPSKKRGSRLMQTPSFSRGSPKAGGVRRRSRFYFIPVLLGAVLAACNQQSTQSVPSLKPVGAAFTLTFDGLGTPNFNASLSNSISPQALTDQQATVKPIRVVARGSMDYIPIGENRSSGFRYVYAVVSVNSTAILENVSFLGVRNSSSSIADTAISTAIRAPGGVAFSSTELRTLALRVKPAQASTYNSITNKIVPLPNTEDTVQYLPESALDYVPQGMVGLLPYGFTVLNSTGGRTLETTTNANRMVVSMKVPLAADPTNDPYAFAFSAVPVTDSETRVTQTLEAQSNEGNAAVVARAAALGSQTSITALPSKHNSPASPNTVNALCSVRTAGSAENPSAYLIHRTPTDSDLKPVLRVMSLGQSLTTSVWVEADGGYYLPAQFTQSTANIEINGSSIKALESGEAIYRATACGAGTPNIILDVINTKQTIDAGYYFSLGIKTDNTVVAWGSNLYGETSLPTTLSDVISVSAGFFHSLALKQNGTVAAWGDNTDGQIDVPNNLSNVNAVAAGGYSSLALKNDGMVVGWGCNCSGQVSIPDELSDVVAISAGSFHVLALKSNGTVVAWGRNDLGQTTIPTGLSNVRGISAGGQHSLVRKDDDTVVAWGDGYSGQTTVPTALANIKTIGTGTNFSLAKIVTGVVRAWGDNTHQQLELPDLIGVVALTGGDEHGLALQYDGTVVAWGKNIFGQTDVPDIAPLTFKTQ
jgi:hypothetical protein